MHIKLIERLQDFFGISRKEARGALIMIILCLVIVWTPFLFRRWILPMIPQPGEPIDIKRLDSVAIVLENAKSNDKPILKIPTRLVDFDPNNASVEQLAELGIPAFIAKRIGKFRDKGGVFRKKEDLLKIYDFPPALYQKLEKHIVLQGRPNAIDVKSVAESDFKPAYKYQGQAQRRQAPVIQVFDINTCDTTQLVKLRGIGSKLSIRILKFRDGLGGFHSTEQYQEVFGLDSLALSELHRYARVIAPVRKININQATAAELGTHSYLKNRKLVAVLVNYRDQHGPFQNPEDLRKTKVIDEVTLKKITPYLAF
jgi:DNA uptake protein ComE-like DNA-binding protein